MLNVSLQFSRKFYYSGCLINSTNELKNKEFIQKSMIFIRIEIPSLYNNLNVHPLEFNFSESYSRLAQFMLLNCGFKLDRKKNKYYIPDAAWERV